MTTRSLKELTRQLNQKRQRNNQTDKLGRIEAELDFRSEIILEAIDDLQGRLEQLERYVETIVEIIRKQEKQ